MREAPMREAPMLEALRALVGEGAVRAGEAAAAWAVHGVVPRAVVAPADAEQAAAVLARASEEGWAVEVAGAGSWLEAGRPPARLDLVVTAERLDTLAAYEPEDLVATAGAGMPLAALQAGLAGHGQWLPLDPPGAPGATLGALASLSSAGPLRQSYGTPSDHVLGLQLVTGDGRILELGGKVVKNVAGYDLVRLVVGSRGTLGMITRVNVRLHPLPERDETVVLAAPEAASLLRIVERVRDSRLEPAALELLSPPFRRELAGEAAQWLLLVRLLGNAERVEDAAARLREMAGRARLLDPGVAGAARLWAELAAREAGAALCARLADRPSALAATLEAALRLPGAGTRWPVAAHAGAGIVRALVPAGEIVAPAVEEWAAALEAARGALAARRGTLLLAGGGRALQGRMDPFGDAGPALRLMRGLKTQFDPAGVLSPGRYMV